MNLNHSVEIPRIIKIISLILDLFMNDSVLVSKKILIRVELDHGDIFNFETYSLFVTSTI